MNRGSIGWTTQRLADVLALAAPLESMDIVGFSTDSRSLRSGEVFIALRGAHMDGHDFVTVAQDQGALLAIVEESMSSADTWVVPNTLQAYAAIATDHLRSLRSGTTVVAVTGSSGKTSTKDLLATVFSTCRTTLAPVESLNNEIGLPATVLAATTETQVLVLEMGMRGRGHIAYLCDIAPPDISIVLNVGSAHIGELGSQDAIAEAKSEIVNGLCATGTAILNYDDERVRAMSHVAPGRVVFFGESAQADVRASDVVLDATGAAAFTLHTPDGSHERVQLALIGRHQVLNACAAAAAAWVGGLDSSAIVAGLVQSRSRSRWRMERHERADGLVVINDAYNANPESMAAALASLAHTAPGRRTVAVLGEMRELGAVAESAHRNVGVLTRSLGIDLVVAVGAAGLQIAHGRGADGTVCVSTVDDAINYVTAQCGGTDVLLCKASRSIGVERVGIALLEQFGTVSP